jgi:hypothetical protein
MLGERDGDRAGQVSQGARAVSVPTPGTSRSRVAGTLSSTQSLRTVRGGSMSSLRGVSAVIR